MSRALSAGAAFVTVQVKVLLLDSVPSDAVAVTVWGPTLASTNLTVLVPCVAPKFVPAIVTAIPTAPDEGLRVVRLGAGPVTVKVRPLLATPPTVTTTGPVVAPVGTGPTILPAFQPVGTAAVPL